MPDRRSDRAYRSYRRPLRGIGRDTRNALRPDGAWLFFPNTLALLALAVVLPLALVVLVLALGLAGALR